MVFVGRLQLVNRLLPVLDVIATGFDQLLKFIGIIDVVLLGLAKESSWFHRIGQVVLCLGTKREVVPPVIK